MDDQHSKVSYTVEPLYLISRIDFSAVLQQQPHDRRVTVQSSYAAHGPPHLRNSDGGVKPGRIGTPLAAY